MKIRVVMGVMIGIVFSLISSAIFLLDQYDVYIKQSKHGDRDFVSAYEERFTGIKTVLPPFGIVGYSSDFSSQVNNNARAMAASLTQFSLSPLVVRFNTDANLVVGNFHTFLPTREMLESQNLRVVRDFGNGVILLSKGAR